MEEVLFVGIDVDDNSYNVAGVERYRRERVFGFRCKPTVESLVRELRRRRKEGVRFRLCYESTYVGFSLKRYLEKRGFECEVVAASLIRKSPSKRIKTDKLDALELAREYANEQLTIVHAPTCVEEQDRDLARSRVFLSDQLKGVKAHITSLCRRQGWDYKEGGSKHYWTQPHRNWLRQKIGSSSGQLAANLNFLMLYLASLENTLSLYKEKLKELSQTEPYRQKANSLRAYRGIDTLSAMTFILELGDINRFQHPRQLASYAGIDVEEYSSGGTTRKYRITKDGNAYLRTAAVECAQGSFRIPKISRGLKIRRKDVGHEEIAIADRCMHRLYKKSTRMLHRGKGKNVTKVACARELLCFAFESLKAAE